MSRKKVIIPDELVAKYVTGNYSLNKLAKEYKIPRTTIIDYFNRQGYKVSDNAKEAVSALNNGYYKLNEIITDNKVSDNLELNTLVVNEVLEIVKSQNPAFAKAIQNVSFKLLKIANEIADTITDSKDVKNLTGAIKDINDTLQVIPKPPAFAQQININKESKKEQTAHPEPIKFTYEVVENDRNKE